MSTSDSNCVDGASKSKNDGLCVVNNKLENMRIGAALSVCANCGKEGDNINICNKCKVTTYCNAVCKKVHKKKHKKECEEHVRLATERAAELHDIELFKQPTNPYGDCPICFLLLPSLRTGRRYYECCGKTICSGCVYAPLYDNQGNEVDNKKCPFCRTPLPSTKAEAMERLRKRVEANDPIAIYNQGNYYRDGRNGFPQDMDKAFKCWHAAAELGCIMAYCGIGSVYYNGQGVEINKKKADYYYELAAIAGDETARHSLGLNEMRAGNMDRSLKHHMIAVRDGYADSLDYIKKMYKHGDATKEDYTTALISYQEYLSEIKSRQRDKAAANDGRYCYY